MTEQFLETALRLELAGVAVEVLAEDALLAPLRQRFAAHVQEAPSVGPAESIRVRHCGSHCEVATTFGRARLPIDGRWPTLTTVVQAMAMAHRPDLDFLHASAVAGPRGALLLVGASTSGKSTLAEGLLRRGYIRLADDCAPLDPAGGRVHPLRTAPGRIGATGEEGGACTGACALRHCCFLVPRGGTAVPPAMLEEAAARWAALRPLFPRAITWPSRGEALRLRTAASFSAAPVLSRCSFDEALPLYLRHLQSPPAPLPQAVRRIASLAGVVSFHRLACGALQPSLDLLDALLREPAPCP